MVNKITKKYMPVPHKVTPMGMIGGEPLILPNYSGTKRPN